MLTPNNMFAFTSLIPRTINGTPDNKNWAGSRIMITWRVLKARQEVRTTLQDADSQRVVWHKTRLDLHGGFILVFACGFYLLSMSFT